MKKVDRELVTYNVLIEVLRDGAFSTIALDKALYQISDQDKAYITSLFYGVLEKNIMLDYIISCLTTKKPNIKVQVVLKMGIYMLRFFDAPDYAVINKIVELVKTIGKKELAGFINATLRKSKDIKLLTKKDNNLREYLSINYSVPEWLCGKLIKRNGFEDTEQLLSCKINLSTHVRYRNNADKIGTKDEYDLGYYVTASQMKKLKKGDFAVQSLSSMIAVNCYAQSIKEGDKVLDLCASPGGKSIYLKDLLNIDIVACDIHPHRVALMEKYAQSLGISLTTKVNDATILRNEWIDKFDSVICDVPCSGIGVMKTKPDILFNRKVEDIVVLADIQSKILDCAKNYVKVGGVLNYSTCTILKEENQDIVNNFLKNNENFVVEPINNNLASDDGYLHLYPHKHKCDGFFVAKLKRIK